MKANEKGAYAEYYWGEAGRAQGQSDVGDDDGGGGDGECGRPGRSVWYSPVHGDVWAGSGSGWGGRAKHGDARAQTNLGRMYYNGRGLGQDYQQALLLFRQAADQGFTSAQFNLGVMYDNGQGVGQDHKQALFWYRKAADQGYANAQDLAPPRNTAQHDIQKTR